MASAQAPSLRRRSLLAGAIALSGHAGQTVIRFGSNLIMTRLLAPEMFGVMALAFLFLMAINLFSDIGLNQNVIQQERGDDRRFLNTVWTLQILRGLLIAVILLLVGGGFQVAGSYGFLPPDSTYSSPELPLVIMAFSSIAVIEGLKSTKLATAGRHLVLGRVTAIALFTQIVSVGVMILIAIDWPTIWVLVIGYLTGHGLSCLLSHLALKGESNALCWDVPMIKEIIGFGKWIFLSSILGFLVNNADRWILGFFLTPVAFGAYAIAALILEALSGVFQKFTSVIAFPALSEVNRNDPARLKSVYYKLRRPADAVTLMIAPFLFVSGSTIIDLLYDDRYEMAGTFLQILVVQIGSWHLRMAGDAFMAVGRPRYLIPIILVRLATIVISVPAIIFTIGSDFVLWGVVLSIYAAIPLVLIYKWRLGLLSVRFEVLTLLYLPVGCLLGFAFVDSVEWLFQ